MGERDIDMRNRGEDSSGTHFTLLTHRAHSCPHPHAMKPSSMHDLPVAVAYLVRRDAVGPVGKAVDHVQMAGSRRRPGGRLDFVVRRDELPLQVGAFLGMVAE